MLTMAAAAKKVESALAFYKGLKVYPAPGDLIKIYDSTVPKVREAIRCLIKLKLTPCTAHIRHPRRDDRLRLIPGHSLARRRWRHQPWRHPQRWSRLNQQRTVHLVSRAQEKLQHSTIGVQIRKTNLASRTIRSTMYHIPHLIASMELCVNNVTLNEPAAALGKGRTAGSVS